LGIVISDVQPLEIKPNKVNLPYLRAKNERMGTQTARAGQNRVFVTLQELLRPLCLQWVALSSGLTFSFFPSDQELGTARAGIVVVVLSFVIITVIVNAFTLGWRAGV